MANIGPNRSFGLILAALCAAFGVLSHRAGLGAKVFWTALAVGILLAALAMPRLLAPARRAWGKLGYWLGFITNPLILGAIYVIVFIPVGGLMRLFRRDSMARTFDRAAASYWINRAVEQATPESLREQF